MTARRRQALALIVLLAIWLGIAWLQWTHDDWMARVDMIQQAIPLGWFLGQQLAAGNIPDWNPHVFGGTPFAADPLSGWMVLPSMLWFSLAGPVAAIELVAITNIAIAAFATFLFARALRLSVYGALVAGIAFGFSTFIVKGNTYCCTSFGPYATWIPVALLGVQIAITARRRAVVAGGIALGAVGFGQLQATWLGQGTLYAVLLVGSFALCSALGMDPGGRSVVRRLALGAGVATAVGALGLALVAASVLPQLAAAGATAMDGGSRYTVSNGREWSEILDRLFDATRGGDTRYIGAVATVFAIAAVPLAGRRTLAPYFAAVVLATIVLQSRSSWLHDLLAVIPRFDALHAHAPHRITPVVVFALAMLVAITADRLRYGRVPAWTILLPPGIIGVVWFVVRPYQDVRGQWFPHLSWLLLAAAAGLLSVAIAAGVALRQRRWPAPAVVRRLGRAVRGLATVALPALVLLDLNGILAARMIATGDGFWNYDARRARTVAVHTQCVDPGGAGEFLQAQADPATGGPARYAGFNPAGMRTADSDGFRGYHANARLPEYQVLLTGLRAICLGIYDAQGYSPIQLRRFVDAQLAVNGVALNYHDGYFLGEAPASPLFPLFSVRYLILPHDIPADRADLQFVAAQWREVFANGTVRVFENPDTLPYARVVHDAVIVAPDAVWPTLQSGEVDIRETVVLEEEPAPAASGEPPAAADTVRVVAYDPDRVALEVTATSAGVVVVAETFADGWRATVDGRDTPVHVAYGAWRAIPVGPGEHEIVMTFETPWLRPGLAISLAGWTLVALAAAWVVVDRRRFRAARPLAAPPDGSA